MQWLDVIAVVEDKSVPLQPAPSAEGPLQLVFYQLSYMLLSPFWARKAIPAHLEVEEHAFPLFPCDKDLGEIWPQNSRCGLPSARAVSSLPGPVGSSPALVVRTASPSVTVEDCAPHSHL